MTSLSAAIPRDCTASGFSLSQFWDKDVREGQKQDDTAAAAASASWRLFDFSFSSAETLTRAPIYIYIYSDCNINVRDKTPFEALLSLTVGSFSRFFFARFPGICCTRAFVLFFAQQRVSVPPRYFSTLRAHSKKSFDLSERGRCCFFGRH